MRPVTLRYYVPPTRDYSGGWHRCEVQAINLPDAIAKCRAYGWRYEVVR